MEREEYLVFMPTRSEGIDYGYLAPVRVLASDRQHAVQMAVEKWWSGTMVYDEGLAVVVAVNDATAYVLGEVRGVEIVAESSLPDLAKGDS